MERNDDLLGRKDYVNHLKQIIDASNKNSVSMSIMLYGEWGSGKTYVLNWLENELKDNNYLVIKYNAWERDFYDEPLVGMLSSFTDTLNEQLKTKTLLKSLTEVFVIECIVMFSRVIGSITKKAFGVDVPEEFVKTYKKICKRMNSNKLDTSFDYNRSINESRELVRNTIKKLAKRCKIVFVIDEIDRCLPDYSLNVLERLHHFVYGIDGVQLLTAVDKNQLNNAVYRFYGNAVDINKYLNKFFDMELLLNEGNYNGSFKTKYSGYISKFDFEKSIFVESDIDSFVQILFKTQNIRFVDSVIRKSEFIHSIINLDNKKYDPSLLCVELLFAYISISNTKREAFVKYFGDNITNPTVYNISSFKINNIVGDFNYLIDEFAKNRNAIHGSSIKYTVDITNFWSFLWGIIILNGKSPSTIKYHLRVLGFNGDVTKKINEIVELSKAISDKSFIL